MLEAISVDNDVRVVVLTGAGRGFCSGADQTNDGGVVPNIDGLTASDDRAARARAARRHRPDAAQDAPAGDRGRSTAPRSAAGCACRSPATSASPRTSAYFRAAGINNGLTASELGLSYLLPRAIGSSRASEIMLTGRDVDAAEAERIGLVSQTVPPDELLPACYDVAERIIGWSRPGVELTKRTLWSSLDAASLSQHMNQEGIGQLFVRMLTDNFEEATRARKEKRTPVFRDMR